MSKANELQAKAIKTIDENVAVNAGAGTGKTKVLTERYVEILENGNLEKGKEIESIVAITFTNKATQEMIERIREEIRKNFYKGDQWRRYYQDMEKARISTIHGFCADILRENPIEAGIDPYFEILDDGFSSQLLNKSVRQVLYKYLEEDERFPEMIRLLNRNRIDGLVDIFISVYNEIRTTGMCFNYIREKTIRELEEKELKKEDIDEIKEILEYLIEKFTPRSKIGRLKDDEIWLEFKELDHTDKKIYTSIIYISENLGNSKKEIESQDRLKFLLNRVMMSREKEIIWLYSIVMDILEDIDNRYKELKRENKGLDYDDLQLKVYKLLDNKEILNRYHKKLKYFMIDEFQDTNELQKKIFYKLSSVDMDLDRNNLFIVGDPKQSIYGFRGADVEVFYNVMEDISEYNPENIITLDTNYRSMDTILGFVNNVFSGIMGDRYDRLNPFNISNKQIDVEILENKDLIIPEEINKNLYNTVYEAELIAKRIRKLIDENRYEYGDIAILFRATTRNHIYEKALEDFNIPYYNTGSKRFFLRQEIKDLINILKFISNPNDKIAAIGVLRSPMIGVNDETVYRILNIKEDNIFKQIQTIILESNIDNQELDKIKEGYKNIEYLYDIKGLYSISETIYKIIEKTDYKESLLLREDSYQSIANINKFLEISKDYENEYKGSLEDFIDYIEELSGLQETEAIIESEDSNVVKLMTIHGSKGLQFPVVIIPELSKGIPARQGAIVFDKDLGMAISNDISNASHESIKDIRKKKEEEESERVLYVAMTRAEELLILAQQGGKTAGYKGLLDKYMDINKALYISDIQIEKEEKESMKIINSRDFNEDGEDINKAELIFDIDGYGKRNLDRFTISQYMKFRRCNREFFFDHHWKISLDNMIEDSDESVEMRDEKIKADSIMEYDIEDKTDDYKYIDGITRGNIVHDFCDDYRIGMDIEKLLEISIKKNNIVVNSRNKNIIKPYIDNYLEYYTEDYDQIFSEKRFHLEFDNGYLNGIIDRVLIKDDKIRIIDFKTNRINDNNRERLIDYYTPQLQGYAYAIGKIMDREVISSSLFFLGSGEIIDIDIHKDSLKKNMEDIKSFAEYINKYQDIKDYKKSNICSEYCNHRELCNRL